MVRPCVSSAPSIVTLALVLMLWLPPTSAAQIITAPDGSAPRPHRTSAHRPARLGWFAEIGGGWIALDTGEYSLDFGSGGSDVHGAGWSIGGGYQATPWIASTLNVRWWRLAAPETYVGPTSTIEYEASNLVGLLYGVQLRAPVSVGLTPFVSAEGGIRFEHWGGSTTTSYSLTNPPSTYRFAGRHGTSFVSSFGVGLSIVTRRPLPCVDTSLSVTSFVGGDTRPIGALRVSLVE